MATTKRENSQSCSVILSNICTLNKINEPQTDDCCHDWRYTINMVCELKMQMWIWLCLRQGCLTLHSFPLPNLDAPEHCEEQSSNAEQQLNGVSTRELTDYVCDVRLSYCLPHIHSTLITSDAALYWTSNIIQSHPHAQLKLLYRSNKPDIILLFQHKFWCSCFALVEIVKDNQYNLRLQAFRLYAKILQANHNAANDPVKSNRYPVGR